jgi:hypothetical protein
MNTSNLASRWTHVTSHALVSAYGVHLVTVFTSICWSFRVAVVKRLNVTKVGGRPTAVELCHLFRWRLQRQHFLWTDVNNINTRNRKRETQYMLAGVSCSQKFSSSNAVETIHQSPTHSRTATASFHNCEHDQLQKEVKLQVSKQQEFNY